MRLEVGIDPLTVFSIFDMDQLRKIRPTGKSASKLVKLPSLKVIC